MEANPSADRCRHLCLKSIEVAVRNLGYTTLSENQGSFVLPLDLGLLLFFPAKKSSPEPSTASRGSLQARQQVYAV